MHILFFLASTKKLLLLGRLHMRHLQFHNICHMQGALDSPLLDPSVNVHLRWSFPRSYFFEYLPFSTLVYNIYLHGCLTSRLGIFFVLNNSVIPAVHVPGHESFGRPTLDVLSYLLTEWSIIFWIFWRLPQTSYLN